MSELVRVRIEDRGQVWLVTFGARPGNILDRATLAELRQVFVDARAATSLKAMVLEGAGDHFSYGASIQEHLPPDVRSMLEHMRGLLFDILESHAVVVAAVRGRCLGGGLEIASICHRIVAHADATFGQPEIAVGVFAPYGSALLANRIGRARAEDLCLTGRSIDAAEARAIGLADDVVDGDPGSAALAWIRAHLSMLSASSLRLAVKAARAGLAARLADDLSRIEKIYLDELVATHDATEGLHAFLQKRPPDWQDR
ncbi:MAG TPA: enoyl-CoA hydratase/isomerase family protein [Vicinamibacterales bacterium]|nr:enoyl-CoA hydratase/isomerase family protein [Vicinamibacterales bacterium]